MSGTHVDDACRGADVPDSASAVAPLPFTILSLERVNFGSKRATGTLSIPGLASDLAFDFFEPANKPAFVASKSIRSKYGGAYERTLNFDPDFAQALLTAVERALEGTP